MSDKELNNILNKLNSQKKTQYLFFKRPISENIEYCKFFKKKDLDIYPYQSYLIKNKESQYVGIVLVMSEDLHWYLNKKHRGNGYLSVALNEIILPHLLTEKEEQYITISRNNIGDENFKASEKVAISVGFKYMGQKNETNTYLLKRDDLIEQKLFFGQNTIMSEEQMKELKSKFKILAKQLKMIGTEIELQTDDFAFSEDIGDMASKLNSYSTVVEDKWYESYKDRT